MKRATRFATAALASILTATLLSGCQAENSPVELPDGVKVSIYQPRTDISLNRIAIQFENNGTDPLTITAASLKSNFFANELVWYPGSIATTVSPGQAIDLRVDIPPVGSCGEGKSESVVLFDWRVGEVTGTSVAEPRDTFRILDSIHREFCFIEAINTVATITAVSLTPPDKEPAPATLLISIAPTGEEGTVTINSIGSTTLLNPADARGVGYGQLDLGIVINADGPNEILVPIVPNRCDEHAIAEDKIGTRMPLFVTLSDGSEGRLVLPASDQLRAEMYGFYTSFCGL